MSKILFHHNCLEQGGAERVISNLANQFVKDGDDVIVATEWQGDNEFVLDSRVKRIHVGLSEKQESYGRIRRVFARMLNLRRLLQEEKPDIAIGFTRKPLYRLLTAAKPLKTPVIIAVRTEPRDKDTYNNFINKICIKWLFPRADGAVFQTESQRDFFPEYIRKKAQVILNPVNPKYFIDCGDVIKQKTIAHSGRLVDFKNQKMMLNAFIKLHEKYSDYTLLVYGPDSGDGTKENLERIIAENKAGDYIKLMGGSDELEKLLPTSQIYVFPSDSEGMPNALLEAMCLGMPVVSTDCPCGGPATVIEDGVNGLLVPVRDEQRFIEAITRLIEDENLRSKLGEEAKLVRSRVDNVTIVNQWRSYIEKVIANTNR